MSGIDFKKAVSVVTGGGNGMGKSIALSLAREGSKVVVADIAAEAANNVAAEINAAGGTAIAVATDVGSTESVNALADHAFAEFGKVDILVNNAGVTMRPFRAVWNASMADFEWMMNINYFGVVRGLRAFLPRMMAQSGRRHIVNTSSFASLGETPGHGMYAASKAALDAMSDTLRAEFHDNAVDIGVTVLFPGAVTTGIAQNSETFRKQEDRSANREVEAYVDKRGRHSEHMFAIAPELVGDMVLRAINADAPYVTTHPANPKLLQARVEQILSGYFPEPVVEAAQ